MNEILQQRIESVQAGKNITHAQIEAKRSLREQLDNHERNRTGVPCPPELAARIGKTFNRVGGEV